MSVSQFPILRQSEPPLEKPSSPETHRLALALLDREIDFIPSDQFHTASFALDPLVTKTLLSSSDTAPTCDRPRQPGGSVGRLGEKEVLTHEQETALFREMNRLKHQAFHLRSALNPDACKMTEVRQITALLDRSQAIRDFIVESNLRLVISLAKKFASGQASFDDLVSDGAFTLMKAVEKFDFDRGFRFSTYAYRSIARDAYRHVTNLAKQEARTTRDAEDWAFEQEEDRSASPLHDQVWSNLRDRLESMLNRLDRRERFIVRSRYALGSHHKTRSFKYLGDKLGVSKERARQLEIRAVSKLQAMAGELDLDDLFGASLA